MIEITRIRLGELDAWQFNHATFQAIILNQGAQLIKFAPIDEKNWLWLSEQATFSKAKAVRGGIPICWPIFGAFAGNPKIVQDSFTQTLPQHGIARIREWILEKVSADSTTAEITFSLAQGVEELSLEITFVFTQLSLSVRLKTLNSGQSAKTITQALHTYLPTNDIKQTTITGFADTSYTDLVQSSASSTTLQPGDIEFNGETDRIYHASPSIIVNMPSARYQINSSGSQSTVIWNPWCVKAKETSQMQAEDYLAMLCVETANVLDDAIVLKPNAHHMLAMSMTREKLHVK